MTADPLFYEIFKEIPELFFELIGQPEKDPSIYKFSAPEIKQRSFRLDGLLLTPENYPREPIYFIEAHSYKDDNFYNQLFAKIVLYLTQYQPANEDWYAVLRHIRFADKFHTLTFELTLFVIQYPINQFFEGMGKTR